MIWFNQFISTGNSAYGVDEWLEASSLPGLNRTEGYKINIRCRHRADAHMTTSRRKKYEEDGTQTEAN